MYFVLKKLKKKEEEKNVDFVEKAQSQQAQNGRSRPRSPCSPKSNHPWAPHLPDASSMRQVDFAPCCHASPLPSRLEPHGKPRLATRRAATRQLPCRPRKPPMKPSRPSHELRASRLVTSQSTEPHLSTRQAHEGHEDHSPDQS